MVWIRNPATGGRLSCCPAGRSLNSSGGRYAFQEPSATPEVCSPSPERGHHGRAVRALEPGNRSRRTPGTRQAKAETDIGAQNHALARQIKSEIEEPRKATLERAVHAGRSIRAVRRGRHPTCPTARNSRTRAAGRTALACRCPDPRCARRCWSSDRTCRRSPPSRPARAAACCLQPSSCCWSQ
jgi:hypothetical protein